MKTSRPRAPLLVALLCVACLEATSVDELLVVTISSDRFEVAPSDTAHLRTTLTNRSDGAVTIPAPSCGPYFFINDSLGRLILPPAEDCPLTSAPVTLQPDDSIAVTSEWSGIAQTTTGDTARLTPGTYSLIGAMLGTSGLVQSVEAVHIKVLP